MVTSQDAMRGLVRHFDGAADAETIALEVGQMPMFEYLVNEVCATQAVYDFIRDIWDVAYSHGMHDALADEGVTLEEMEESGI